MKKAWDMVKSLVELNATHRRGQRLQEISLSAILDHVCNEIQELREEPNDLDELGDILAPLFQYAIRQGWTMEQLETSIIRKLPTRFTV